MMPLSETEAAILIKDPIRGYIAFTETEKKILDLHLTQRLRNIRWPAGVYKVYPGADTSLMGHMLGFMGMTDTMFDSLPADESTVFGARLTAMILTVSRGAWANVMEEFLENGGADRYRVAELAIKNSAVNDIIGDSTYTVEEVIDFITHGIPLKHIRINLSTVPINPELLDSLERDAYFTGVDYANIDFKKIFLSMAVAKNRLVVSRDSRYTLESYLAAGANMFEAVYYHKTVRAAELMLLRIIELGGDELFPFPLKDPSVYLACDDFTFHHRLLHTPPDSSEDFRTAGKIFRAYRDRDLIKLASMRSISDHRLLKRLSTSKGRKDTEREIAESAEIDPQRVYVDIPKRPSVTFYPGRHPLDSISMYERGSRGYEFWSVEEISPIAKSLLMPMQTVRVYTTRGYRQRIRKVADSLLESFDTPGSE
ncbi:MAG: hypothetical protein ACTSYL_05500 [Candidatus Thorarchaeota archaeon]